MNRPDTATTLEKDGRAVDHRQMANALRALAMDAVEKARSGHPGMPMGMADVATVLFTRFLKFDPQTPDWPDRDRFVLSAGHGSMLLYALLHLTGYADFTIDELKCFRQLGAKTAGHPEYGHGAGIETTTGPLGQGLANAVGMALAERMMNARFSDDLVDHMTYVIAGDGCLMEGISQEVIALAGHLKLSKLVVLWDDNEITIDGAVSLSDSTDQIARFEASGWNACRIDGHDPAAIAGAIDEARLSDRPSLIACRTTIGFGAPTKAGTSGCHGSPLGATEIAGAREALDWPYAAFEIPDDIRIAWSAAAHHGTAQHLAWNVRLNAADDSRHAAFTAHLARDTRAAVDEALARLKQTFAEEKPTLATRVASQKALEVYTQALPQLIGGSADLTGSNGTRVKAQKAIAPGDYAGDYINYGIREHAMAAVMNGMALHGGFIPYGGTFLVFADYCRPAIRLSALMGQRVVYVMTHDSIGLGEDGPTHQPVEHLASLRAIPNLLVFRPADAIETAEAWACALAETTRPSLLALSRQNLPALRSSATDENRVARGGYILSEPEGGREVTLIATGSEVSLAMEAADLLASRGIGAAVVSMPSFELFSEQPADCRARVLGDAPRIGVEAAIRQGWDAILGPDGRFIGMTGFGASAPAEQLYRHFGITPETVAEAAAEALGERSA
ncbi:transketolase [Breoghania corrubedonensis]|uniref:Transketolase n=1 Tax=Breoghania corrubedonensis TaxID=665038 RepID=A0A2T5VB49_9HYPH|nr:transketolase [Breoghania corrubedonensis]PTW60982.1 transketolase [Breoghania corrubedonensis]